jgi:SulP family sulfate permease
LVAVLLLNPIISQIPEATLAGILLGTSYRIARPSAIREALATTRINAVTLFITALTVLLIDLIWGIALGIVFYTVMNKFKTVRSKSSQ